jgi:hypothetical protein
MRGPIDLQQCRFGRFRSLVLQTRGHPGVMRINTQEAELSETISDQLHDVRQEALGDGTAMRGHRLSSEMQ